MSDSVDKPRQFHVVLRGSANLFFAKGENLRLDNVPTSSGPVRIVYTSRRLSRDGVLLPGHLWIHTEGSASTLEQAIHVFGTAALGPLSTLALTVNAAVAPPQIELAYESTPNKQERPYFQSFLPEESRRPRPARCVDVSLATALLQCLVSHADSERLFRACHQYLLALKNLKLGHTMLVVAHLWMAIEALTKAKVREQCRVHNVNTERELASRLKINLKELDAKVRRDMLLYGDIDCYKKTKKASDGFEHGFGSFPQLGLTSQAIHKRLFGHVRRAILDLSGMPANDIARLLSEPFLTPQGPGDIARYLRGTLVADSNDLAAPNNEYPFIRWASTPRPAIGQDGQITWSFQENLTPELAAGVSFRPGSIEVWKPL